MLGAGGLLARTGSASAGPRAGYVKDLTGEETARFGFRGTDLGFTARTNHGYCITIFGDTFDQPVPQNSTGWRSPVGLRQSNTDIQNGIRWDNCIGGGRAKELIPYVHTDPNVARNTPGLIVTEIPNDLIHLPDGRYMMTTFGVRDWAIPDQGGIPSAGGSWRTWYSRQWTSTDTHAENWTTTWNLETNRENMDFWNDGLMAHFQNNAMIMWPGEDWVYFYGTNEGRWAGGGIHLMRVPWNHMWERSQYTFWVRRRDRALGLAPERPVDADHRRAQSVRLDRRDRGGGHRGPGRVVVPQQRVRRRDADGAVPDGPLVGAEDAGDVRAGGEHLRAGRAPVLDDGQRPTARLPVDQPRPVLVVLRGAAVVRLPGRLHHRPRRDRRDAGGDGGPAGIPDSR